MRRPLRVLLILGTIVAIIILIGWFAYPGWQLQPGGFWAFVAAAVVSVSSIFVAIIGSLQGQYQMEDNQLTTPSPPVRSREPIAPAPVEPALSESLPPPCFHVAPPPADFVGRTAELEELLENFESGAYLYSAAGAGVGTSALARCLAYAVAERFPGGCLEIDLQGAAPDLLAPLAPLEAQRRLLQALHPGRPLPDTPQALRKLYRDAFSENAVLLLLDNAASATQLRPLMPKKPSAVIVTSRTDLGLGWARLYPLALNGLRPEHARELLRRIAPGCANVPTATLDKISERLGFNPMALRVVAALFREPANWKPKVLLKRLPEIRKRLAALRNFDAANLNPSIALELGYEALPPALKEQFELLSVFPTSFTMAAATAIWETDTREAEATLNALVRGNLLDYNTRADTYVMHDLARFYAQALLLGQPELTRSAMQRYADYVLAEAARAGQRYVEDVNHTPETVLPFAVIWPHLWTAWLRMSATDPGWPCPENADRWLCDFPIRAFYALNVSLTLEAQLSLWERALEAARALGDLKDEGIHLSRLGQIYTAQGDHRRALECHEQQLQIACEHRDRHSEADALARIGLSSGALGHVKRAEESWRQALALFEVVGDGRAEQVRAWLEIMESKLAPQR